MLQCNRYPGLDANEIIRLTSAIGQTSMNFLKWIKRTSIACALFSAAIAAHAAPTLWVSTGGAGLATVDVATGATSFIGNTSVALTDIAFNPSGDLYGISFSSLYKVNSSTGATTLVGSLGSVVGTANALVFGSDGTLYMAGSSLYTVNTLTGAASAIGSIGYQSGGDLAFIGSELYMASSGNQLIDVDTTMGTEATLGLRPISSVTLYRIAQYKIPLAFNALYFPYSETTHLFGVNPRGSCAASGRQRSSHCCTPAGTAAAAPTACPGRPPSSRSRPRPARHRRAPSRTSGVA
jgi:hypothetical protein